MLQNSLSCVSAAIITLAVQELPEKIFYGGGDTGISGEKAVGVLKKLNWPKEYEGMVGPVMNTVLSNSNSVSSLSVSSDSSTVTTS